MGPVSNETKKKISATMKKKWLNGELKGWVINYDKTRMSYPEKVLDSLLRENGIYDKYRIERKLPYKGYFLDFAIIDLKIDIEMDGGQHYNSDKAKQHDRKRNEFLNGNGWGVYRINWNDFKFHQSAEFSNLLKFIKDYESMSNKYYEITDVIIKKITKSRKEYLFSFEEKMRVKYNFIMAHATLEIVSIDQLSKICKIPSCTIRRLIRKFDPENTILTRWQSRPTKIRCRLYDSQKEYFDSVREQYEKKQRVFVQSARDSSIDFSKFGWVKKLAPIINQKPQKVKKWMLRFMPEFYSEKCFKKNASIV